MDLLCPLNKSSGTMDILQHNSYSLPNVFVNEPNNIHYVCSYPFLVEQISWTLSPNKRDPWNMAGFTLLAHSAGRDKGSHSTWERTQGRNQAPQSTTTD